MQAPFQRVRYGTRPKLAGPKLHGLTHGGVTMSSTLDPDNFPPERPRKTLKGHDVRALGPSDSADTGADMVGQGPLDDTSDRNRTGERMGAGHERVRADHDIGTDRVVGPEEAGLGIGLDEAEKAWVEQQDRGEH